jgi:hypothetical protein
MHSPGVCVCTHVRVQKSEVSREKELKKKTREGWGGGGVRVKCVAKCVGCRVLSVGCVPMLRGKGGGKAKNEGE